MAKKKEQPINYRGMANILIYDNENIKYYKGNLVNIEAHTQYDSGVYMSGEPYNYIYGYDIIMNSSHLEETANIELDDTTMKRIAKFNKTQECKRLDKKIEAKEEKIKELDDLLQDKEKRWKKVNQYIKNIYDLDLEEDEDDDYYEDWDD